MKEETKNNYELKKQERERAQEDEYKRTQMEKTKKSFTKYGLWILVIAVIGYGIVILARAAEPDGEDFSIKYNIQGRQHIANNASHPLYNSNPPSSGWHYASPVRGGLYSQQLPDEQVIHNLEHGDIWIAYHPDISDEAKEVLESFAGQFVVVSPRSENITDVSLVAWGRIDTFDIENVLVDKERIRDFIKRYDNRGPENVRGVQTRYKTF